MAGHQGRNAQALAQLTTENDELEKGFGDELVQCLRQYWQTNQYPTEAQLQPLIEQFHIGDHPEKLIFFLDLMKWFFYQREFDRENLLRYYRNRRLAA